MAQAYAPLAIVTGASSGIGRSVAVLLARKGHRTILIARRRDRLNSLARELSAHAPSFAASIDLAEPGAVESNLPSLLAEHGPPDVLVNNAGFGLYRPFLQHTAADHHRLMQVNYFAAISMIRSVLPGMVQRKRGHIINVASMASKVGPWGHTGYAASKAALVSATQTLAAEHATDGIHFSYVNPGIVRTDYFATGSFVRLFERVERRAVDADVVARQMVGLLDKPRLELCVPSSYRLLDWIRALSPRWAHRLVAANSRPPVHQTTPSIPSTPPSAAARPVTEIRAVIDEESPAAAGRS